MIISRTPFRVSFFGGGTDFPEFYARHGGAVLTTTIDKFCYITIHRLAPFFKYRFKASYARTETVMNLSEIQHPLIRESLMMMGISDGVEIAHVSDLPGRTGLGTSSSFTVGLLNALHTYLKRSATPEELAREAITVERERARDPGGHQDQYAAAYGGLLRLDFSGTGHVAVKKLSVPASRTAELQSHLMMFYTGMEQSADHILTEQKKKVKQNIPVLMEMLKMVDEAEHILTGNGDLRRFGELLHESWMHKKTLSSRITNDMVDQAYETVRGCGAIGGKLLGAGGRGFLLVCAPPERHKAIRDKLTRLQEVPFSLTHEGSRIIFKTTE
jgi:D-glycero-alpha-D-manno-heptose-7-phosphate kinase